MKIHLYSVAWNEEKILPFFLRHYEPWVDRFFIADHESTDRTPEILAACSRQTSRKFTVQGDSFVHQKQAESNQIWKQSRGQADWVVVCDMDEFLYHPDILQYLAWARKNGITIIKTDGYQMVSDDFPAAGEILTSAVRHGAPSPWLSKIAIFNPDAIEEINYSPGHHQADPTGRVVYPPTSELKLLHYKFLGHSYCFQRHQALHGRRHPLDLKLQYGVHYRQSESENLATLAHFKRKAVEVVLPSA